MRTATLMLLVACATSSTSISNADLEHTRDEANASVVTAWRQNEDGIDYMRAAKYQEASSKFRDAVARVPEPAYFFNLCMSLWREGKLGDAVTSCTAVAKHRPTPKQQAKTDRLLAQIRADAQQQGVKLEE